MRDTASLQVRCNARQGSLRFDVDVTTTLAWTVLFGPSGSGKSSLLRLVAGLWSPPGAHVIFNGHDLSRVPAWRRRFGLVAQKPALFPHLDVLGNIRFGSPQGVAKAEFIDHIIDMLHLHALRDTRIHTLSGGEYQRVALARALASQPGLLLLDEVFTGMHSQQRTLLLHRLQAYCASAHLPVLSVTHDVVEACSVGEEILRLNGGRITARGSAADVLAPEREALRLAIQD